MGKRGAQTFVTVRGLVAALGVLVAAPAGAACAPDQLDVKWSTGSARFTVEVADDEGERSTGLMAREKLASSAGMLFVYPAPVHARFWMHDTLIALDMIFIDETGTVQRVHSNAVPRDDTPIDGGPGVKYVLEINGGLAERLGIATGAVMRNAAVSPDLAAWSCDAE